MNTIQLDDNWTLTLPDDYTPPPLPGRDEWCEALESGRYKQHTKTDWSKVDWSLPNSIIQGMFHVCEDTVRNNRRKYA